MATYIYNSQDQAARVSLVSFAKNVKGAKVVTETTSMMTDWSERMLGETLASASHGDTIVVLDAVNCARSHSQVISFLEACLEKGVRVEFVKYGMVFRAEANSNFMDLLNLSRKIESDFVARRNQEAIAKRQEFGIVLGRPKGRKNKALKLDKYKKDIMRYLELSISKASIAKLVDCHPQTLYDWIERNEVNEVKPRRRKTEDELV